MNGISKICIKMTVPSKNIKVEKDETFRKVLKQNAEFSTFGYQHSPPPKKGKNVLYNF